MARKSSARTPSQEEIQAKILQAVEEAIRTDGERRLISKGTKKENAGLFGKGSTNVEKAAIDQSLSDPSPLFVVIRTEREKTKEHRFVRVNKHGIQFLAAHSTPEQLESLIEDPEISLVRLEEILDAPRVSEQVLEKIHQRRIAFLRSQIAENQTALDQLLVEQQQVVRDLTSAFRELLARQEVRQKQFESTIRECQRDLDEISTTDRDHSSPSGNHGANIVQIAQILTHAWEEAKEEARAPLERAMRNSGLKMIGQVGSKTTFEGAYHTSEDGAFEGDRVEIRRVGWLYEDAQGENLLVKAQVETIEE